MREISIFGMRLLGQEKFLILGRALFLTGRTYFNFHTELTELTDFLGQKNIRIYFCSHAKGAKYLEPLMDFFCFTQTARTLAEFEEHEFLWDDNFDKRTKEHNALRPCLEFFTRNTQNHAEWIVSRRRRGLSQKSCEANSVEFREFCVGR